MWKRRLFSLKANAQRGQQETLSDSNDDALSRVKPETWPDEFENALDAIADSNDNALSQIPTSGSTPDKSATLSGTYVDMSTQHSSAPDRTGFQSPSVGGQTGAESSAKGSVTTSPPPSRFLSSKPMILGLLAVGIVAMVLGLLGLIDVIELSSVLSGILLVGAVLFLVPGMRLWMDRTSRSGVGQIGSRST
jgi:hypothetical protein